HHHPDRAVPELGRRRDRGGRGADRQDLLMMGATLVLTAFGSVSDAACSRSPASSDVILRSPMRLAAPTLMKMPVPSDIARSMGYFHECAPIILSAAKDLTDAYRSVCEILRCAQDDRGRLALAQDDNGWLALPQDDNGGSSRSMRGAPK